MDAKQSDVFVSSLNKTASTVLSSSPSPTSVHTSRIIRVLTNIIANMSEISTPMAATPRGASESPTSRPSSFITIPPTRRGTSEPLQIFSFDFIDTKEFQDRMADILAGRAATPTTTHKPLSAEATTAASQGDFLNANLGILIPIVAFAIFIMAVVSCVIWQAVHDRIRPRTKKLAAISTFYRKNSGWEGARSSTRSTTPLQMQTQYGLRDYVPKLDRISESPEDRLKGTSILSTKIDLESPDSSLTSMLSRLEYEISNSVRNAALARNYSYPAPPPSYMSEVSQSYPNLALSAQAPFSPYHLTWATPGTKRPVASDPNGLNSARVTQLLSRLDSSRTGSTMNDSGVIGGVAPPLQPAQWKSPYHPNFNTPTDGSEPDIATLPPNAVLNYISSSLSLPPEVNQDDKGDSSKSASDSDLVQPENRVTFFVPSVGSSGNRPPPMTDERMRTPGSDYRLSAASNPGSWQYNRLYVHPFIQMVDPHALEMGLSHNSSNSAMMGSSNASMLPPIDSMNASMAFHPDHPDFAGAIPRYPNTYALNDPALFLTYDRLAPLSPAPPYEIDHVPSVPMPPVSDHYGRPYPMQYTSNNTSTCGQMDSLESSITGSTVTVSRNTSGYTAGPSHSTSINGQPLSHNSTATQSQNSSLNTSKMNSMSSILPVRNDPPVNPNTLKTAENQSFSSSMPTSQLKSSDLQGDTCTEDVFSSSSDVFKATDSSLDSTKTDKIAAVSSMVCDGLTNMSQNTTSNATSSSAQDQSQHTTAPDSVSSLQWDSFSFSKSSGNDTISNSITTGSNMLTRQRSGISNVGRMSPINRAALVAAAQLSAASRRHSNLDWDTYPFYSPDGLQRLPPTTTGISGAIRRPSSMDWDTSYPVHTPEVPRRPSSTTPGNTGPPPSRQPHLAQTQWWV